MGKLFDCGALDGIVNKDITPELAFSIGKYTAVVLTRCLQHPPRILIGHDTRISADMLECALCAGILSVGGNAVTAGILSTPAVAYLTKYYGADVGISIASAHSSYERNGLRFFGNDGIPYSDTLYAQMEDCIFSPQHGAVSYRTGLSVGTQTRIRTAEHDYAQYVSRTFGGKNLLHCSLLLDCSNGTLCKTAPALLENLGAEVFTLYTDPTGTNINVGYDSEILYAQRSFMDGLRLRGRPADVGISVSGDGCSLRVLDENGNEVCADALLGIFAIHAMKKGDLRHNTVLVPPTANIGLTRSLRKHGIQVLSSHTDIRRIADKMRAEDFVLGGDPDGHIINRTLSETEDGFVNALHLLSILSESRQTMSEIASDITILPRAVVPAVVDPKKKPLYRFHEDIIAHLNALEAKYNNCGRVWLRPVGNQPQIDVWIEGPDAAEITADANAMAQVIGDRLS